MLSQPPTSHGGMLFEGFGIQITEDHDVTLMIHVPLGDVVGVLHVEDSCWMPVSTFVDKGRFVCCVDVGVERNNVP